MRKNIFYSMKKANQKTKAKICKMFYFITDWLNKNKKQMAKKLVYLFPLIIFNFGYTFRNIFIISYTFLNVCLLTNIKYCGIIQAIFVTRKCCKLQTCLELFISSCWTILPPLYKLYNFMFSLFYLLILYVINIPFF